tara:strand:+ start:1256 stop:1591 length:336 start_codon:yes stop_codon:yes gene_type:complete
MATFSSHLLNSVNGSHANNIEITIYQIKPNGEKKIFYNTKTDDEGRVLKEFDLDNEDCKAEYEMICKTGDYFLEKKVVSEITVKFKMVDSNKKYHIPIIISPNGYTIWWSD